MAIYARCCKKDYKSNKRKCVICNKNLTKFVVKIQDPASRKWKTQTVTSLKFAREIEAKLKTDLIEGKLFNIKQKGVIDFGKYIAYAKMHKKTWELDQSRWTLHVMNYDYYSKRGILQIMNKMKKNGYAPCTIHHVLKLIKRVYNWSIENEYYFDVNPCNSIKTPKYDNRVTNYLSKEEISHLLHEVNRWGNIRGGRVVKFALYTGRRKGEITNLEWDDIDFNNKTVTCRNTKNGNTLSFPLNALAFQVIEQSYADKISKYVFPSSTGKWFYNGFSLAWKRFKKKINIEYRFHDLRHTFASQLASSGKVDIYTLKTLLGHQDITLTMRYAHLTNDAVKQAACVMDDIINV